MIKILVEGASDFTMDEVARRELIYVPITITLDEISYRSGLDIDCEHFYSLLTQSKDFPKTAQPSPQDFLDHFEAAKENGDEIICLTISSALSGTYQSAMLAKSMADYEKIYVIDTMTATFPIRIMADYARRLITQGLDGAAITDKLEELKKRTRVMAGVDTLEYLCRGGRLSRTAAAIGELANLKPVVHVNDEGKISVLGKCLGRNKAAVFLLKTLQESELDPEFPIITLYSADASNCERFEQKLTKENYQISERLELGPVIGTHVGPGAFGVAYVIK